MITAEMKIVPGMYFSGTRKDNRYFVGIVANVKSIKDRSLVCIQTSHNGYKPVYKSVYLDDMGSYIATKCPEEYMYRVH